MSYTYPTEVNVTATEGLLNLFKYVNIVTNSWFSNMLLIAIYIIFATGFYFSRKDMGGALAVGGFATFVIATLFYVGEIISGVTFAIVIAISIVSFASLFVGKE